jgi:hypothetical protein
VFRHALRWFAVAFAVSLLGAVEGSHLMASLNDPIPGVLDALHASADPAPVHPRAPARRVVVVLIDGLGADAFDARLREGALGEVHWKVALDSGVPSRSRPVYHAILTGVPQWAAGIRGNGYATGRADSVVDRVRAGGGKVAWMLEDEPWFYELFGDPRDIVVEGRAAASPEAFRRVWDAAPDLTVLHLTEVDEAGHLHGADSAEYVAASRRAIAVVAAFRAAALTKAGGDAVVWLVGADHGHTAYGGHGGPEQSVRRVSWAALDDAVPGGAWTAPAAPVAAAVTSLAPTIARALGVDAPRESMAEGLPLLPALLGEPYPARQSRIGAVEAARTAASRGLLGDARSRGALIVGVLIAALAAVVGVRGKRGVADVMVLVVAVVGFLVAGPGLSMSAVRTEGWYLFHGLATLTLFAVAAWAVARRWASPMTTAAACVVFPVVALVAMRGSLGLSDATPIEMVLWPSLGLVPASVCAAIALVEVAVAGARRVREA